MSRRKRPAHGSLFPIREGRPMSQNTRRRDSVNPSEAPVNGPANAGDAREPEALTDTSFNPTEFEQPAPAAPTGPDPFDPASLRLSQDFAASIGVKKALLA